MSWLKLPIKTRSDVFVYKGARPAPFGTGDGMYCPDSGTWLVPSIDPNQIFIVCPVTISPEEKAEIAAAVLRDWGPKQEKKNAKRRN